jgi:hypothetical protein
VDERRDEATDDLRGRVGQHVFPRHPARGGDADRDGGVEVSAGDVTDGVGAAEHGDADREPDDEGLGLAAVVECDADDAEHEEEGSEGLGDETTKVRGSAGFCHTRTVLPRSASTQDARRARDAEPIGE